jgi:hypothetical protein
MSYALMGKTLPNPITDYQVALLVAKILRAEHLQSDAVVKRIARATGANTETVKKWYNGQNAPSAAHLITLMRTYPSIYQEVMGLAELIPPDPGPCGGPSLSPNRIKSEIYTDNFVGINVLVPLAMTGKLNERQFWFLGQLQKKATVRSGDIVRVWRVTARTAERDVATLVAGGLVFYAGPHKVGKYQLRPLLGL